MSTGKKFTPTQEMITASEDVFYAMAHLSLVEPIVLNYQKLILKEGQWRVKRAYVGQGMADEVVLDPNRAFVMEDEDFAMYDSLCKKAQLMAGLQVKVAGNCPLLEAMSALSDAQARLVQSMSSVTGHSLDQLLMLPMDKYQQFVDLSLRLLSPFADPHKRYGIPKPSAASGMAG